MPLVCLIVSEITYPNSIATENDWLDSIIGIFVRTNDYSYFPFFTWALWPLLGYLFGRLLIKTENKMKMYSIIAVTGAVVLVLTLVTAWLWGKFKANRKEKKAVAAATA